MKVEPEVKIIKVLIGQVHLTRSPHILQSVLGSCIGLVMYDQTEGIAGMAHILLPSSEGREPGNLPGKYADRAIPCLLEAVKKYGAVSSRVKAKIAGGAQMFNKSVDYSKKDVGACNVDAVRKGLQKYNIPIVSSDVGGTAGRKIEFSLDNFRLKVEDFAQRSQVI